MVIFTSTDRHDHGYECDTCPRRFRTHDACAQHERDRQHGDWQNATKCATCNLLFLYEEDCDEHMEEQEHWPSKCETCSWSFSEEYEMEYHMNGSNHWATPFECETCTAEFRTQEAANEHMHNLNHELPRFECEMCTKRFRTERAADQHMNATKHWAPTFDCETCVKTFRSQHSVDQHMAASRHYKNYCGPCGRRFGSANELKMHLNSKVHRGSTVGCPFCKATHTTASGLAHHLETGSCSRAPQLNRETILRMVREMDPGGNITTKQLGWHDEENAKYSATSQAFNGDYWECHLCHKLFNGVNGLNMHVNSPVHKQKVYRCPSSRSACGRDFVSLAGLFNHLESESCNLTRFENVQRQVGAFVQGRRMIAF